MKQKVEPAYEVQVNGMPDYGKIPRATLEPIAKKFLGNILKWQKEKKSED